MKILELHYSTSWAGAERFVVDLCNELVEQHDTILCTIEDDNIKEKAYYRKELKSSIKYINLKCKSGLQLKALWKIYQTIKKEKPDVVHAHTDLICLFLPALLYSKAKYFHTLHSLAEVCLRKPLLRPIYQWFYKQKITPITISSACYNSFLKLYKAESIKIDNGRSPLHTTPLLDDVHKEVNSLKLHLDDKVFIHVARCQPEKNQELLINSFNKFLENQRHGILIMIGACYDTPENKHLLNLAKKGIYWLGLKNNVCDYLQQADFFILSSLYEGLPISLLEAMSCGITPVCTPVGGIPDVIKNKNYGYLSKGFDVNDFYIAIQQAYDEYNTFDKQKLIKYFNDNFSMTHCAEHYIQLFKSKFNDKKQE